MTAFGASRPLRRIPAIVSFLNPQPALSLGRRKASSCPTPAIDRPRPERRPQMESGRSRFARRVMPML
jgi:hypothetical protein